MQAARDDRSRYTTPQSSSIDLSHHDLDEERPEWLGERGTPLIHHPVASWPDATLLAQP
jgi:hypothetical protein